MDAQLRRALEKQHGLNLEGYVSRAAFKLKQIQTKHKIIHPGSRVLDLGCAPGAWMQVACQEIKKKKGLVLGIDIQEMQIPKQHCDDRVKFIQADAKRLTSKFLEQHSANGFDVVLSDMMGFTTGNSEVDVGLSLELCATALQLATGYDPNVDTKTHEGVLVAGGNLVMKLFEVRTSAYWVIKNSEDTLILFMPGMPDCWKGRDTREFIAASRCLFENVSRVRPKATRKASREFYVVCKGRILAS